jgi:N-acetylmuramoyl-L-alanine amidase
MTTRIDFLNPDLLVILDAGHGRNTPGKRSPAFELDGSVAQFMEWEFNLDIRSRLQSLLTAAKINSYLLSSTADGFDTPIGRRVREANRVAKQYDDNAFLVSIHSNAMGRSGFWPADGTAEFRSGKRAHGFEVYRAPGSFRGFVMSAEFEECLGSRHLFYNRGSKEATFQILTQTTMPAVLTESGFYTDREEVFKLMDTKFRDKIAYGHFVAIQNLLFDSKISPDYAQFD